jgi:hypothetical protein
MRQGPFGQAGMGCRRLDWRSGGLAAGCGAAHLRLGSGAIAGCDVRDMISLTDGQPVPGFCDAVREAFSTKGILAKSRDFAYRPQ